MFARAAVLLSVIALVVSAQSPEVLEAGTTPHKVAAVAAGLNEISPQGCYYNGCRCNISPGGLACLGSNVYQCSPSGDCCIYGYRESCAQCGRINC
ncbi:hypothetical protein EMPS_07520 [Entomortierella parvispora]|uniref:Uncharacterized protein n=1 Tax=Entomortierella parvispora TaxID=205924 RepID=A0A9P3HEJ0_9FUNG|nr:hypothetical protein EMPS_07520 [Entomortierella parvispora]